MGDVATIPQFPSADFADYTDFKTWLIVKSQLGTYRIDAPVKSATPFHFATI